MNHEVQATRSVSVRIIALLCFLSACAGFRGSASAADDHGDTPSAASFVFVGDTTSGVIDGSRDLDYFEFEVTTAGTYVFYTRGEESTNGYLYDSNGREITHDTLNSGEGSNFRIVRPLSPGTYYLRVSWGSSGSFGIFARFYDLHIEGPGVGTVSDDHGFSPWSATPVLIGSVTAGDLDVAGDLDYFEFEVTTAGTYVFYTRSKESIDGYLYDSNWNQITRDTLNSGEGSNLRIVRPLSPGTYYLRVSWGSSGTFGNLPRSYDLHVEGPGAGTVSDDHGFSPWSATSVLIGSVTAGDLDVAGDLDYFEFEVTTGGKYVFYTRSKGVSINNIYMCV